MDNSEQIKKKYEDIQKENLESGSENNKAPKKEGDITAESVLNILSIILLVLGAVATIYYAYMALNLWQGNKDGEYYMVFAISTLFGTVLTFTTLRVLINISKKLDNFNK